MRAYFASRQMPRLFLLFFIAISASSIGPALANTSPTNAELREAIAALEARVAALEAQLQQKADTQQEASIPRPTLVALGEQAPAYSPMRLGNQHQPIQQSAHNGWSGLYWGTSFGYGSAFSKSRYRELGKSRDQFISEETEINIEEDGSTETTLDFFESIFSTTSTATGSSNGTDEMEGVLADLYLGASALLTPRVVAGFQVEGSLAEMTFGSSIGKEKVKFKTTETDTFRDSSSDGDSSVQSDTSHSSGTGENVFPGRNEADLDWMVSVIGRAGVLATPTTFLYGLAGWSYGHFQVNELTFGGNKIRDFDSDGPTVGGGIEKKLSSKWSLRAEYRYTNFGSESFSKSSQKSSSTSESGTSQQTDVDTFEGETSNESSSGGTADKFIGSETVNSKGSLDNDMHVGRIGVTRYFTLGD